MDRRGPKIAVPTRTWVAPKPIAISKSALMPMLSSARPLRRGDLAQQGEMRRRLLVARAGCTSARRSAGSSGRGSAAMKASASSGMTPAFCGSSPVLTSMKQARAPALALHLAGQRLGQPRPVHRLDHVEQRHRLAHLVGLQRADQMEPQIAVCALSAGYFACGLLHPVLAEDALAGRQRRGDRVGAVGLRHRHQGDRGGIAAGGARGGGDARRDARRDWRRSPRDRS